MAEAAAASMDDKAKRGRKKGWRKTTKAEDKIVLATFKKNRPPGCGIDSREVKSKPPRNLQAKISRRLIIRRLAAKGFKAQKKLCKNDVSGASAKRRMNFATKYRGRTKAMWNEEVQAVGDFKIFTHYPKKLYKRFRRLRASWTYMTKKERHQAAFLRPKKWFPQKEWKLTKQLKVFAMTTSTGKILAFPIPSPFDGEVWQTLVKRKVVPFLQRSFPNRATFKLLIDSEKILHSPPAKQAYRECGIEIFAGWPKCSSEPNPQENVWPESEITLRAKEGPAGGKTFEQLQQLVLESIKEYKRAKNLIGGIVSRVEQCPDTKGIFMKH